MTTPGDGPRPTTRGRLPRRSAALASQSPVAPARRPPPAARVNFTRVVLNPAVSSAPVQRPRLLVAAAAVVDLAGELPVGHGAGAALSSAAPARRQPPPSPSAPATPTAPVGGRGGGGAGGDDYMYSEEEFQMQLAMALSASNSDCAGDRDRDQIRDAKLMSLGGGDRFAAARDDGHRRLALLPLLGEAPPHRWIPFELLSWNAEPHGSESLMTN
ncbi:hypothetical protein ZWY2020_007202 [Hordeum vulgare]|nr:hypothetical protein ZWY2020_007202 [Hordeum vulgare]